MWPSRSRRARRLAAALGALGAAAVVAALPPAPAAGDGAAASGAAAPGPVITAPGPVITTPAAATSTTTTTPSTTGASPGGKATPTPAQAVAGVLLATNPLIGLREAAPGTGNGPMSLSDLTSDGRSPDTAAMTRLYSSDSATGQFAVGTRIWTAPLSVVPGSTSTPRPYLAIVAAIVPFPSDAQAFVAAVEGGYLGKLAPFPVAGLPGGRGLTGTGTMIDGFPSVDQLVFFTFERYAFAVDLHYLSGVGQAVFQPGQALQIALAQREAAAAAPEVTVGVPTAGTGATGSSSTIGGSSPAVPTTKPRSRSGSPTLTAVVIIAVVVVVGLLVALVSRRRREGTGAEEALEGAEAEHAPGPEAGAGGEPGPEAAAGGEPGPEAGAGTEAEAGAGAGAGTEAGAGAGAGTEAEAGAGVAGTSGATPASGAGEQGSAPGGWPVGGAEPAWLPDPAGVPGRVRYWDGTRWTAHVADPRR